jgi:hypothetical protein
MPFRFFFFVGVLIRCNFLWGQGNIADTVYQNASGMDEIVRYGARDSIFYDVTKKKVYLYGGAYVETQTSKINSGIIVLDFSNDEIEASTLVSEAGLESEYPEFTDGNEKITCRRLRMNTRTKKAYLEALSVKQEELYFYMGVAKRYPTEDIHLKKGRLTTCDQEEPHYHFQLSRGVVVPEKRIVAGTMNLWISGIPTPFGLPFAFIPQQKERTRGILFPEFIPSSPYGFGVQNLGYFIPINPQLQTSVYANVYSRGSWGIRNELDYAKRYGYTGKLSLGFQQFNNGFPSYARNNKFTLAWIHTKQQKSNPLWQFNSKVNFISDNTAKNNPDPINPQYFNNSFNSDINLSRVFPGKPIILGSKISVRQNSLAKNIALLAPVLNLNVTRFFPFQKLVPFPKSEWGKAFQRVGVTYNLELQNKNTFGDSLLQSFNLQKINALFFNGLSQAMGLQTTFSLLKNTLKISPNLTYGTKVNFQQIDKNYASATNATVIDTLQKTGLGNEFNASINATTVLYSYYRFVGKNKPILRHLMTPTFGYRYVPKLNNLVSKAAGPNQSMIVFSPFERSLYSVGNSQASSLLNFGVNNSLELKVRSSKDTVSGYRKIRILDQFSLSGNYDFLKDSMPLSDLALNLRVSPFTWINFVANGSFSPYGWNDSTGKAIKTFALQSGQGLGRLLSTGFNTTLTLSSKKSRELIEQKKAELQEAWNADYTYYTLHPEQAIYFDIPWKLNISHVVSRAVNTNKTVSNPSKGSGVQTLAFQGDVSFSKRWNLATNINVDLKTQRVTNMNLSLNRNMHCWALSFYWIPIGGNKSFLLSIRNTSNLFKDAKLELRRPPSFF